MFEGTGLDCLENMHLGELYPAKKLKRHMSVTGVFSPGYPCVLPLKQKIIWQGCLGGWWEVRSGPWK